jgi:putative tricarboxylic transport membrane protein
MGIPEGFLIGLLESISLDVLPYLIIGSLLGLILGIIPGLSGHFAMAMVIPFIYTMEPAAGIAFLLAAHATVAQGGGLTAILFNTPGTGQNAATLLDGPPMVQQGLGGRAVGAALTACFLGASFGAIALAFMLPVLQSIVLFFGPPEIFMLAFLALTFVAILAKEDLVRSLIAAFLGLLLSFVGLDNVTNQERFTFGSLSLWDGIALVPLILGLFAVSEMIYLWIQGGSLSKEGPSELTGRNMQKQIFQGVGDTFKRWWLVIRCSTIGTIMGLIPGLGSAPAAFVAYGHAKQTSKSPETFGKGNIEGVIGPESANDAVEGGALASTIAFGIPGSSSMAILLGGLFILGLEPGPKMINNHVDLVFVMIFTIVFANLIGTIVGMFIANPLARVTFLRGSILVPTLIIIVFAGAYMTHGHFFDIGVALIFGIVGFAMKVLNYSRAALLIGFVLGFSVERNLYLSLKLHGSMFFLKPIPLTLLLITLIVLSYNIWTIIRDNIKGARGDV